MKTLKQYHMDALKRYYEGMSTGTLIERRVILQMDIESNDGRLTAHSSADLDHSLDKRAAIDDILSKRQRVHQRPSPAPFNPEYPH